MKKGKTKRMVIAAVILLALTISIFPVKSQATQEITLYLHEYEIMDEFSPMKENDSEIEFDDTPIKWYSYPLDDPIDVYDGEARLYLKIKGIIPLRWINASLIDVYNGEEELIASCEERVFAPKLPPLPFNISLPIFPHLFSFENIDYRIEAGHSIALSVKPSGLLSMLSSILVYDSFNHPSYLSLNCTSYEFIDLDCYNNEKDIEPGETAEYEIEIRNNGPTEDEVSLECNYEEKGWDVSIDPDKVSVDVYGVGYAILSVSAPSDASRGDFLLVTVSGAGKTGYDSITTNTTIPEEIYGVIVEAPKDREGEPGKIITHYFTITNTGNVNDTYNLEAESEWNTGVRDTVSIDDGKDRLVPVNLTIPSDAEKGIINNFTLTATSQGDPSKSDSANVTTTVIIPPSQSTFDKFLGWIELNSLPLVIAIMIILIVIGMVYLSTKKWVEMNCLDRLIEIVPGKTASFDINIKNPLKKRNRYQLKTEGDIPPDWKARIGKDSLELDGGERGSFSLEVSAPNDAKLDQWASIDVIGEPFDKPSKKEKVITITLLKKGEMKLSITNVVHRPTSFKGGERVVTKAKIRNDGDAPAKDIDVALLVNDKERNRIKGATIPAGGYASIEIPWIANYGENRISIRVE